ncbi:hypothetical protein LXL04_033026 [Taraxacum kok-saghyz]
MGLYFVVFFPSPPAFAPSHPLELNTAIDCTVKNSSALIRVAKWLCTTYLDWKNMSSEIGESVEVIGNEDGMDGYYFAGKVIDHSLGRRTIRYGTLIGDDGSPLEEVISNSRLCPPPPTVLA